MPRKALARKPPAETASQRAERALVAAAVEKLQRGQTPTAQERTALKRWEQAQEDDRRWSYYRTTPKSHYLEMSGRAARIVIDQAARYGLPYPPGRQAAVDLGAVILWLHDFLAKNAGRLNAPQTDDPLLSGVNSPALERYRIARACREELELAVRKGELLGVNELLEWYDADVAAPIRRGIERLHAEFGEAAAALIVAGLDRAEAAVERKLRTEGVRG